MKHAAPPQPDAGTTHDSMAHDWMAQVTSPEVLAQAWDWLEQRRGDRSHNDDYWHARFHRATLEPQWVAALRAGTYRFSPCKTYHGTRVWCAQDALVLKALSLVLTPALSPRLSRDCYHLTGNGGAKGCVRATQASVGDYRYVCSSDVNSYYASIDHRLLMGQLAALIDDARVLALIGRMLDRLDDINAELFPATVGITKGNPLSPLLGAVYLDALDRTLGDYSRRHGLFYARFMDDWVVLCRSRWQLREVVRLMNQVLSALKVSKHPFKTVIGRLTENGFDFLGYRIGDHRVHGVGLAWATWVNHLNRLRQLYEQGACVRSIGEYVTRWLRWVRSGVEIGCEGLYGWERGRSFVGGAGFCL